MNGSRMPSVEVSLIRTKSCYLKLEIAFQYDDYSEMRADCVGSRKQSLHDFGSRVSGNVVILRRQTAHHVPHATTGEVRNMTSFAQVRGALARRFFHGGWFHQIKGGGGSSEPPALRAKTITEWAIEVNRPYLRIARRGAFFSKTNK